VVIAVLVMLSFTVADLFRLIEIFSSGDAG